MLSARRLLPFIERHILPVSRAQPADNIHASTLGFQAACSSPEGILSHNADVGGVFGQVLKRTFGSQAEVWTWGKGEEGQLGHAVEDLEKQPRRVDVLVYTTTPSNNRESSDAGSSAADVSDTSSHDATTDSSSEGNHSRGSISGSVQGGVKSHQVFSGEVSCGLFHSAAVLEGLLFMWGKGQGGRLGIGDDQPRYQPARVPLKDVSAVSLGGLHSLAVTQDGWAWSWGFGMFGALGHGDYSNQYEPTLIQGPWEKKGDRVVSVAGGGAHSAAVTASGALYTWGRDEGEGRLGVAAASDSGGSSTPLRVHGIEGRVVAAACGGFHTLCLTDDGRVWSFGANANGELGRESGRSAGPRPIEALEGRRIRHIACGGYHSAAVTEDGVMLTWGHGGHAQLGHGELRSERSPRHVDAFRDERVRSAACGGNWTSAVTDDGRIFTWGKNRDYQLGRPLTIGVDMEPVPREIPFSDPGDGLTRQAVGIASGAHHGAALVLAKE